MCLRQVRRQFVRRQEIAILISAIIWIGIAFISDSLAAHNWTEQIAAFKPMVVNVETSSEIVFEAGNEGYKLRHRFHR